MPVAPYGTTNPRGLEPWQIESTIAPAAYGGSQAEAQNMIDLYRTQRETAGNEYSMDLAAQHQYAYDALRQQMQEAYLKAVPEYQKEGLLPVLAGTQPGALYGADPATLDAAQQQYQTNQAAKNFEASGKGYEGFSNAGVTFNNLNQIPGLQNADASQTENVRLAAERIRANAMLGAAAIHASAARPPKFNVPLNFVDETGKTQSVQVPIPQGATDEQARAIVDNARRQIHNVYPPGSGVAGIDTSTDGSSAQPPPPPPTPGNVVQQTPGRIPSLKPAPGSATTQPATTQQSTSGAPPQVVTNPKVQQLGQIAFQKLTPQQKLDVSGNMAGTTLPIIQMPNGTYGFRGKSGTVHTVPGAS